MSPDGLLKALLLFEIKGQSLLIEALRPSRYDLDDGRIGSAADARDAMGKLVTDNLVLWFEDKGPLTPVPETPFSGRTG